MLVAAVAFVGVSTQWLEAVTPVMLTLSLVAAVVVSDAGNVYVPLVVAATTIVPPASGRFHARSALKPPPTGRSAPVWVFEVQRTLWELVGNTMF